MIITYNWLKEFVDFQGSPEDLCERLTMAGLEVESMEEIGGGLDAVVVARLLEVKKHPDADRLTLCRVDTGSEEVAVVCGATNHQTGDLVALAPPGTLLPGDVKIKKSKIRGQISEGMLCSEKELGLSDEADGIMILEPRLPLGEPVFAALGLKDVRIEIGLTPNRPDCLSLIGVAREVAALYGAKLTPPPVEITENAPSITERTSVTIENAEDCPRYAARMIEGVTIAPSPDWLVRRLQALGLRSINNVVDVTNYVMMELGHPLHAFDFNLLDEGRIVVKSAHSGDCFTTLDDQEHQLDSDDLMICDGRRPVALAGVMGGLNSEVREDTDKVLLEAAYFKPTTIRRTSKRHALHTESSHRFERGADIDMIPRALERAAGLIAELSGGHVLAGVIDKYPNRLARRQLTLQPQRAADLLAIELSHERISTLLESIGLEVRTGTNNDLLLVTIPNFRPDLEREVDLIEELARLAGYDQIPVTLPHGQVDASQAPLWQQLQNRLRQLIVSQGFAETLNYSFVSREALSKLNLPPGDERLDPVPIRNPLSEDQAVMRTSLVPSLLETAARNHNYRNMDLRLFELRPVFISSRGEGTVEEHLTLAAVMTGRRDPEGWAQDQNAVDFFDVKGVIEELLGALKISDVTYQGRAAQPYHHPGKACAVRQGEQVLGSLGEIHPQVAARFAVDSPVYLLELDVAALLGCVPELARFKPLSRFPDMIRDTALLLDEQIEAARVLDIAQKNKHRAIEQVTLFDLYTGQGIPVGKKSLAIRVRYRDLEKTLTETEVNKAHDRLVRCLCKQLGAEIR